MKKFTLSFIAITVCLSIYAPNNFANNAINKINNKLMNNEQENKTLPNQCFVDVPVYNRPMVEGSINNLPVLILSDEFTTDLSNQAIYQGNVSVIQGNREITADQLILNQTETENRHVQSANTSQSHHIELNDDVLYQDNLIQIHGDKVSMSLDSNDIKIKNPQYHLVGRLGRGSAESMQFTDNRYIVLNDGNFTSCPIDDNSWNISGSKLIHDNQEQLLEVWNAVFKIGKVPILYSPYLQLPTGNKRRSGLLIPNLSYDSIDGIDFSLPIYWNIAPNYDATFTPRAIERRGIQLQTEFRYLNALGLGDIAFDWMQYDDLYSHNKKSTNNSNNNYRWLFHWKNKELINDNWRLLVDATRVNDNQYITDLGSNYASETDGYLTQHYQLGYTDEKWDINLNYKYFQPLYESLKNELYHTQPQLNIHYYDNLSHDSFGLFNFNTFGQISHFVTSSDKNPKTWRFHIQPTLDYTLMSSWALVSTQAGFLATRYEQDVSKSNTQKAHLEKRVNRFIPKFSVDGKVIFKRDIDSLVGYTQTLTPRIKYLYTPYQDQSHIDNYDSTLLQSDYVSLFREQSYSGLDKIASSNKVVTGVTTHLYDDNETERFNLSLGQIYYFTHSKTGDQNSPLEQQKNTGSLTWATDAYWLINDEMIFRSGIQYDTRINEIALANAIFEYRQSDNKMAQLSYRYANRNYINSIRLVNNTPYQQDISQIGVTEALPLTENINAVGAIYYDVKNNQITDNFIGLHYADCCWGVRLQYGRKTIGWNSDSKTSEYENKLSINFELRELSTSENSVAKMLDFGLLPYKTAFE